MNIESPNKNDKSLFPDLELEPEDDDSWQVSYLDIITILLGFLVILLSFSELNNGESFSVSELFKSSINETEFITTPIEDIKEELENLLEPEIEQGKLEIFRDLNDVRIRFKSDDLYTSGSANLQPEATQILNRVLAAFKLIRYDDFEIDVEGHTDNVPITSAAFASNWELSTSRASNIVKYFSQMGIPQERLKASGYADSRPVVEFDQEGNPYPASKDQNRRVVLRLYYSSPEQIAKADSLSTIDKTLDNNEEDASNSDNSEELASSEAPVENEEPLLSENTEPDPPIDNTSVEKPEAETTTPRQANQEQITTSNSGNFENGCRYSIQVGSFESFANSLEFTKEVESLTGVSLEIMYNNVLFSTRTVSNSSFLETIGLQETIDERLGDDQVSGFVQQCYDNGRLRPQPLQYQIQLAFFQNEQNAINFKERLSSEYNVESVIEQKSLQAYTILTLPISNISATQKRLDFIQSIDELSGAFIKFDPQTVTDYTFNYQIQLGSFALKQEADVLAKRLRDEMNVQSSIKTLSSGRYYLVTRPYSDWDEITNLYGVFERDSSPLSPVIYLIERI